MKLRLARRALADAKRLKTWWRENRPAASDVFEEELNAALDRIAVKPNIGVLYERGNLEAPVRRLLLPKTKNHVYYAVHEDEIVVVSIWGAPKEHGPKL
jgi:plasmid stabilization system protein ParE